MRTSSTRIAVIADLHANPPALEAALGSIRADGCDPIYHLGDALAIGPHPRECLELLLSAPEVVCLMGNHESYFVQGIPDPRPPFLSAGEAQHQEWVRAQLPAEHRMVLAEWPWVAGMPPRGSSPLHARPIWREGLCDPASHRALRR